MGERAAHSQVRVYAEGGTLVGRSPQLHLASSCEGLPGSQKAKGVDARERGTCRGVHQHRSAHVWTKVRAAATVHRHTAVPVHSRPMCVTRPRRRDCTDQAWRPVIQVVAKGHERAASPSPCRVSCPLLEPARANIQREVRSRSLANHASEVRPELAAGTGGRRALSRCRSRPVHVPTTKNQRA